MWETSIVLFFKKILFTLLCLCLFFAGISGCSLSKKENSDKNPPIEETKDPDNNLENNETPITPIIGEIVVEALYYEKDVIETELSKQLGWESNGSKHRIRIPKLNIETSNAMEVNKRIYDKFSKTCEILKADEENNAMFSTDYEYCEYNGLVGIIISHDMCVQCGGGVLSNYMLYYDVNNDKELSFKEYLSLLGFTAQELTTKLEATREYKGIFANTSPSDNIYLTDCIMDKKGTAAIFNDPCAMDGWSRIDTKSFLN